MSISVALPVTGIGSIILPISCGIACGMTISNNVIFELNIQKHNKSKEHYERTQRTINSFDKLYRKCLQDKVSDKKENESLCNNFTKYNSENRYDSLFFGNIRI